MDLDTAKTAGSQPTAGARPEEDCAKTGGRIAAPLLYTGIVAGVAGILSRSPLGAVLAAALTLVLHRISVVVAAAIERRIDRVRTHSQQREAEIARQCELRNRRNEIIAALRMTATLDSAFSVLLRYLLPGVRFGFAGGFLVRNGHARLVAWRGFARRPDVDLEMDAAFLFRVSKCRDVRIGADSVRRGRLAQCLRLPAGASLGDLSLFRFAETPQTQMLLAFSPTLVEPPFTDRDECTRWLRETLDELGEPFIALMDAADHAREQARQRFHDSVANIGGAATDASNAGQRIRRVLDLAREMTSLDRVALYSIRAGDSDGDPTPAALSTATVPPCVERCWRGQEMRLLARGPQTGVAAYNSKQLPSHGVTSLIGSAALIAVCWRDSIAAVLVGSHRSAWRLTVEREAVLAACAEQIADVLDSAAAPINGGGLHSATPVVCDRSWLSPFDLPEPAGVQSPDLHGRIPASVFASFRAKLLEEVHRRS